MRRLLMFLFLAVPMLACAQTQQGYVKILGRPDKKGVALSGVFVRVKGGHNAVLSKQDGTFALQMSGKKNGDAYALQQVQKEGYELNEVGVIGRQYAFSDKVPLTIVMVSITQLQADKQRIENNAYQVAERNYNEMLAQLEEQKDDKAITIEEYRQRLRDLQDKFEKYQSLIDGLADHYAHVDYDNLDEKEREINLCIENAELERADSLLHTLFDPTDVLKRNKNALDKIEQQESQAHEILAQANADMAAVLKQQEKDAEYLYQLYTIALAKFDNKKAAKYIETRAELDSTNVKWQQDAGDFASEFLSDYPTTIYYYQRAFTQAQLQYGEHHPDIATSCVMLAFSYEVMGKYQKALAYCEMADKAIEDGEDEYLDSEAGVLLAQGRISMSMGKYDNDIEGLFLQALNLLRKKHGHDSEEVASCLTYLGGFASIHLDTDKAISYYQQTLDIRQKLYASDHPRILRTCSHLSMLYSSKNDFPKALEYAQNALHGLIRAYGKNSKDVGACFASLSSIYSSKYDYEASLKAEQECLNVFLEIYGDHHPEVANAHNALGNIYSRIKDYENAIDHYQKALDILIDTYGEDHPSVGHNMHGMANVFVAIEEYDTAQKLYDASCQIFKAVLGEKHIYVATIYNDEAVMYAVQGEKSKAIMYYEKSLGIKKQLYGKNHSEVAITYGNIAMLYGDLGNIKKANSYWNKSLKINRMVFGENSDNVGNIYTWIGTMYFKNGQEKLALDYFKKALDINLRIHEEGHPNIKTIRNCISVIEQ